MLSTMELVKQASTVGVLIGVLVSLGYLLCCVGGTVYRVGGES